MWIHCIYEEIQTFIKPKMVMTTTDYYVYVFVVVTQCNKLRCVFDQCPHVGLQLFSHCTPTPPNRCITLFNCQREQRQAKTFGITSSLCDREKNVFRIQFSMLLLRCNQNGLDMLITKAICDRLALK